MDWYQLLPADRARGRWRGVLPIFYKCHCGRWSVMVVDVEVQLERLNDGSVSAYPLSYPKYGPPCACGLLSGAKGVRLTQGRYSKKRCGEHCTNAMAPTCSCECGGANHGIAWVASRVARSKKTL